VSFHLHLFQVVECGVCSQSIINVVLLVIVISIVILRMIFFIVDADSTTASIHY